MIDVLRDSFATQEQIAATQNQIAEILKDGFLSIGALLILVLLLLLFLIILQCQEKNVSHVRELWPHRKESKGVVVGHCRTRRNPKAEAAYHCGKHKHRKRRKSGCRQK